MTGFAGGGDTFPTGNPLQPSTQNSAFVSKIAPAVLSLSQSSLTFGPQDVGTTSTPQTATVTLTGEGTLLIWSISAAGDFAQTNTCGSSVTGSGCTINVTFTPTATGARSGSITIVDNASVDPQTISLSGTGTALSLSATSLSFGAQLVGAVL